MTDQEVINQHRNRVKYGFFALIANAALFVLIPAWPHVMGSSLHFFIIAGIVLFMARSNRVLSNSLCRRCGKKIYPYWVGVTGWAVFQKRTACSHCHAPLDGNG